MFCSQCGTKNNDSAKFCSSCGTAIAEAGFSARGFEASSDEELRKKSNKTLITWFGISCCVLVALGAFLFYKPSQISETNSQATASVTQIPKTTENSEKNPQTTIRAEEAIPKIVAKCGSSNGPMNLRLATDVSTGRLYFGSFFDQGSLELTKISGPVKASQNELTFQLFDLRGKAEQNATFDRKSGGLKTERINKYSSEGPYNMAFDNEHYVVCESLADSEHSSVLDTLRDGRRIGEQRENRKANDAKREREAENARPNKF